ncbi:MAG TPA: phospholipase [Algoriphagus sp.]|jgi:phospholipase/carboxylesterase|uniref:alpha/beta hydrolase n=1 Tax=unclassified Algoriphagus TaxID=2641541 RepID=UPI000C3D8A66|nr:MULTISPECIES: dienelactone hydrolase family protein [unclassified Algoriphagus]MAL14553.1 phospholipase [Algoriphagus sp.]MAN87957.1 phospholipase [Algoriphagus sp.]HCD88226.1 phospholipase [Algoriphagus sp.]HCH43119.1 phospholipase [Algoriphagus sp.]|tara:strand:+ start:3376 stop:3987 length:612 start_codon:yes stop_codon:yes gene_type:complete
MTDLIQAGKDLKEASSAAILIHGRGASAQSIISLKSYLKLKDFALLAPQAEGNTWYPYSFMAPDESNQQSLKKSLGKIQKAFDQIVKKGIPTERIYLIGFSQGACLSLEFAALNAQKLGGVVAFTGGLIGEKLQPEKYKGNFDGTPVFIGSSNRDFHVPLTRIEESAQLLEKMGASVKTLIFDDPEHTIREEELEWVNEHLLS